MKNKKYILLLIISIVIILALGITYAWLTQTLDGSKIQSMRVGTFKLSLQEGNSLSLQSAEFMSDEDGLKQDGFTFTVENTGKFTGSYSVYLDDDSISNDQVRLDDKFIKYNLEVNGTKNNSTALSSRKIYDGSLDRGKKDTFTLRIWLNKDVNGDIGGQVFKVKLRIEANQEMTPVPVAEKLLASVGNNGAIDTSDSEQTFITGTDPNNYIWYSGKLWRAVSIDPSDNSVKLVTQWNISSIPYNSENNNNFQGSYMEQWLNDTTVDGFLGNLREPEKFIKTDSVWNATLTTDNTKPGKTTMITDTVGLLNLYEYSMSHKDISEENGYLNNTLLWWALNPYDASSNISVETDGKINISTPAYVRGIRPSVILKNGIKIVSGTGTSDDPYRLQGDNDKPSQGTLLSTRYSGEYIRFGTGENNLYRVVSHENGSGTKITSTNPLKNNSNYYNIVFGTEAKFKKDNTIGTFLNETYLAKDYVTSSELSMIESDSTWYLGYINDGYNYRLTKYQSTDSNVLTTETTVATVGLLRISELMAGQFSLYSDNTAYWTITPYWTYHAYNVHSNSFGAVEKSDASFSVKPAMNLKSNVIITGGDGTKNNPFTLALG